MIKLYKDIKNKFYTFSIVGVLLIVMSAILTLIKTEKYLLFILLIVLAIVYVIGIAIIFMYQAIKRLNNLSAKASSNVGVRNCISEFEELINNTKNPKLKTTLLNNLSGAYINIGELDKAMKTYDVQQPVFDNSLIGKQNHIIYIYNVCEISIRTGIYFHARSNMALMKVLIDDEAFNEEQKKRMNQIYSDVVVWLVFAEDEIKDYESIEKYYLKRFAEEDLIAAKVFFAYQLSKVYKKMKKTKESKKYMDFYMENKEELNYEW